MSQVSCQLHTHTCGHAGRTFLIHMHAHTFMHTHTHICMHVCAYTRTLICTHMHTHIPIDMHSRMHAHTHTHIYTYTRGAHAHTYMCTPWPLISGLGAAEISLVYEEGLFPPSRWNWVFDPILSCSISTSSHCLKGVQRAELGS